MNSCQRYEKMTESVGCRTAEGLLESPNDVDRSTTSPCRYRSAGTPVEEPMELLYWRNSGGVLSSRLPSCPWTSAGSRLGLIIKDQSARILRGGDLSTGCLPTASPSRASNSLTYPLFGPLFRRTSSYAHLCPNREHVPQAGLVPSHLSLRFLQMMHAIRFGLGKPSSSLSARVS